MDSVVEFLKFEMNEWLDFIADHNGKFCIESDDGAVSHLEGAESVLIEGLLKEWIGRR